MTIGMGNIAAALVLAGICALAWRRQRNVGGLVWSFRVIPPGLMFLMLMPWRLSMYWIAALLVVYAIAAHQGAGVLRDRRTVSFVPFGG